MGVYDVAIIGSGPAGIFTALEIAKKSGLRIALIDKERYSSGGLTNDCKLNLTPDIGVDDYKNGRITRDLAFELISYVKDKFVEHGADPNPTGVDENRVRYWQEKVEKEGARLVTDSKQIHVGTDKSKFLIDNFKKELKTKGVDLLLDCPIEAIEKENGNFKLIDGGNLVCKYLVVCPGRANSKWFMRECDKLGVKYNMSPIEIGVRIEMPREIYDPFTNSIYDPKIRFRSRRGDDVKTFCTNPGGKVRLEHPTEAIHYHGKALRLINGDACRDVKTNKTNFALLWKVELDDPPEDTREHALNMALNVFRAGGWKPVVQRMDKFFMGKRSKRSNFFDGSYKMLEPSLSVGAVEPGDITFSFSSRLVDNLRDAIETLDRVVPGVKKDYNLVYAPELKLQDMKVEVKGKTMESSVDNLFVAGNGVGLSSGIVGAAVNGILAGRGILGKM